MEGPIFKKTNEPHKMEESQGEHQGPEPLLVARSLSNKERGGFLERMSSRVKA
jgi:hypothetical protein